MSQTVSASNDFSTFSRNSGDFMRCTNCTNWSLYRSDTKHTKHRLRSASMNTDLFFSTDSYKIVLHYYSACYCISSIQQTASIQLIEQCFTSPPTQYRLYGRRFLQVKRPNQQYQSTEGDAVKENNTKKHKENRNFTYACTHKIVEHTGSIIFSFSNHSPITYTETSNIMSYHH